MKKILLALAVVPLVAAGCARSSAVQVQTTPTQVQSSGSTTGETKPNVQIRDTDQATDILYDGSTREETKASSGDDSDVMSSSSNELDTYSNVTSDF